MKTKLKCGQIVTINSNILGNATYRIRSCNGDKCRNCDLAYRSTNKTLAMLYNIFDNRIKCGWDPALCLKRLGFDKTLKKL